MKLSKFNVWVKDYPGQGEYLLFNCRTQALIRINQEFKDALYESVSAKPASGVLSPQIKDNLKALRQSGIIVENEQEEEDKIKDFFRQLKYEGKGLSFEATILTTYSCNFKCVYCFEESVKESVFLDKHTSELIVHWLIRRAEKRDIRRMFVVYYGGEPLLNIRPMYDISQALQAWAQRKGVEFGFGMITNGSLLTSGLAEKLVPLGLKELRITLDAERPVHNRRRPFLDGSGTFDVIVDNIKSVIDKVNIEVVGNFDRESFKSIPPLLDFLEKEDLLYRLSNVGFSPLVPRLGPKQNPGAIELSECISYVGEDGLFNETINIKKELLRRGLKIDTGLTINICPLFVQDAGVTIDPKGVIYKCNSLLGYPEFAVGDVREEEFNGRFQEFSNVDAWKKCASDCPYVPMCQGGCRFFSFLEYNDFSALSCKRKYLDRITPELIKLEYEKLQGQKMPVHA